MVTFSESNTYPFAFHVVTQVNGVVMAGQGTTKIYRDGTFGIKTWSDPNFTISLVPVAIQT